MAYKEETEEQFLETVVRQARGRNRPVGNQQFNGEAGFGPDDESFGNERNGGFQNLDSDFSSEQEDPHAEMEEIKLAIQDKERELHELKQRKVKLMRIITGRL